MSERSGYHYRTGLALQTQLQLVTYVRCREFPVSAAKRLVSLRTFRDLGYARCDQGHIGIDLAFMALTKAGADHFGI
jgi:hypothetical protein